MVLAPIGIDRLQNVASEQKKAVHAERVTDAAGRCRPYMLNPPIGWMAGA